MRENRGEIKRHSKCEEMETVQRKMENKKKTEQGGEYEQQRNREKERERERAHEQRGGAEAGEEE